MTYDGTVEFGALDHALSRLGFHPHIKDLCSFLFLFLLILCCYTHAMFRMGNLGPAAAFCLGGGGASCTKYGKNGGVLLHYRTMQCHVDPPGVGAVTMYSTGT